MAKADNVINVMDALKKSIAGEAPKGKKPRKGLDRADGDALAD
jgi:non-homologous end joining protein Ku